jgi:hypothetical protein
VEILDETYTKYEAHIGQQTVDVESDEMKSLMYENLNQWRVYIEQQKEEKVRERNEDKKRNV